MEGKPQEVREPFNNERGPIASYYSQLQAISKLDEARSVFTLERASDQSILRSIFQSMEIALLNVADLLLRTVQDVKNEQFGNARVKLSWMVGFHRVMVKLSFMPQKLGFISRGNSAVFELKLTDSPAFHAYFEALQHFDLALSQCEQLGVIDLEVLLAQRSLDDNQLSLLHLARLCNHEATIWESNLNSVSMTLNVRSYEQLICPQILRDAVYDTFLEGDTYYAQFRGLHQIPEILATEINDHIEIAILQMRSRSLEDAYEHLRHANILSEVLLISISAIVDNLTTADYHNIRENLGLTSGSHSVNIHYHLFKDLYEQVWHEFSECLGEGNNQKQTPHEALSQADLKRREDQHAFLIHLLTNELLKLRAFISEWRNEHLHLPRNNIGGGYTKSLTGSPDAVQAVKRMRDVAAIKDQALPIITAHGITSHEAQITPLTSYFDTSSSFDRKILEATGNVTRARFKNVQERLGIFANKGPFVPPAKRKI
jgi:tryptophan 2,3-dioxygenase